MSTSCSVPTSSILGFGQAGTCIHDPRALRGGRTARPDMVPSHHRLLLWQVHILNRLPSAQNRRGDVTELLGPDGQVIERVRYTVYGEAPPRRVNCVD